MNTPLFAGSRLTDRGAFAGGKMMWSNSNHSGPPNRLLSRMEEDGMECRSGCAACCIAVSISTPIPGMPHGKAAGIPCVQLTDDLRCALFGKPERPAVCSSLMPSREMCGASSREALAYLEELERLTRP